MLGLLVVNWLIWRYEEGKRRKKEREKRRRERIICCIEKEVKKRLGAQGDGKGGAKSCPSRAPCPSLALNARVSEGSGRERRDHNASVKGGEKMTLVEDDRETSPDPELVRDDHDERELLERVKGKYLRDFQDRFTDLDLQQTFLLCLKRVLDCFFWLFAWHALRLRFLNEKWNHNREEKGIIWSLEVLGWNILSPLGELMVLGSDVIMMALGWKMAKRRQASGGKEGGRRERRAEKKGEKKRR